MFLNIVFLIIRLHYKRVHKKQITEQVNCQFCAQTFTRLSTLYTHCNRSHLQEVTKIWCQCLTCNFCLPDVFTLRNHVAQVLCHLQQIFYICCNRNTVNSILIIIMYHQIKYSILSSILHLISDFMLIWVP